MSDYAGIDDDTQLEEACTLLRNSGVVAFPTDTVYGLGADVFNEEAVKKVFTVKKRPLTMALPVLVCDMHQLRRVAADVTSIAETLINRFWPGGLTIIMRKSASVPGCVTAGDELVAVRMPDHRIPLRLMRELNSPIIGTSANVSGKPTPLLFEDVEAQLGRSVDYIIRSNTCRGGIESTIVDITSGIPVIIRHGIIPDDAIIRAAALF